MILEQLGNARRVLMIQGPFGPFFRQIATGLENAGYHVIKVNLNMGDRWYFPQGIDFTGDFDEWPIWLEKTIAEYQIDAIMVFSDARIYHRMAHDVAERLDVLFLVFEEGYLRPSWITLEPWGANAHSRMSRNARDYKKTPPPPPPKQIIPDNFAYRCMLTFIYYIITWFFKSRYPHYQHHREVSWYELWRWMFKGTYRKLWYKWTQRHVLDIIRTEWKGRAFLFPLQVHNDSQLWLHGGHAMEVYIEQTMVNFALHAPANTALVIKHHPLDRAYRDYTRLIREHTQRLNLTNRVYYVHDIHLPSLFPLLRGTITVNSSVGMTSLEHGVPTKTLGRAIYNFAGLTHQGSLDTFWNNPTPVDRALIKRYRGWLIARCQLQGAVYLPQGLVDPRAFLPPQCLPKPSED